MKTLKLKILAVLFSAFSISAHAQNKETRQLASFEELHVGGSWDVIMEQGNKEEVRLEGKGIDLKNVVTEVKIIRSTFIWRKETITTSI